MKIFAGVVFLYLYFVKPPQQKAHIPTENNLSGRLNRQYSTVAANSGSKKFHPAKCMPSMVALAPKTNTRPGWIRSGREGPRSSALRLQSGPGRSGGVSLDLEELKILISSLLVNPKLVDKTPRTHLSLLRGFQQGSAPCVSFFSYVLARYPIEQIKSQQDSWLFWHAFINDYFREFATSHRIEAQEMVDYVVIPDHPFSAEIKDKFLISAFLSKPFETLSYVGFEVFEEITRTRITEALGRQNLPASEVKELDILMQKYCDAWGWSDSGLMLAYTVLSNVHFKVIQQSALSLGTYQSLTDYIKTLALASGARDYLKFSEKTEDALVKLHSLKRPATKP